MLFRSYAGLVVFLMYVASVMIILLVGVVLRHTMFRGLEPEPLMLALPHTSAPAPCSWFARCCCAYGDSFAAPT